MVRLLCLDDRVTVAGADRQGRHPGAAAKVAARWLAMPAVSPFPRCGMMCLPLLAGADYPRLPDTRVEQDQLAA
ncbi:hypothetical protein CCS01_04350 [Rhodopila globiformis]|uniref:Uncharacterized protein n=1 Tax=Rhodopila globiformis TaxID=1071 RepID=A0A2S6NM89_RHOGL|nr:hypothetical protein CCS01_04350 [Rhodopila globiformis]